MLTSNPYGPLVIKLPPPRNKKSHFNFPELRNIAYCLMLNFNSTVCEMNLNEVILNLLIISEMYFSFQVQSIF